MPENTPNEKEEEPKHISRPILKTSLLSFSILTTGALSKGEQKNIIPLLDRGGLTKEELEDEDAQLTEQGILGPDGKVIVSE